MARSFLGYIKAAFSARPLGMPIPPNWVFVAAAAMAGLLNAGIWLVGARGGVAATAITGLCALKDGLVPDAGLVSRLPAFRQADLPDWSRFVVGGHEIRDVSAIPKLFADFAAQGESEIWNIQISDRVTAPVMRQTIKRGHGNM